MKTGFVWHERFAWGLQAGQSETFPDEALFEPWQAHDTPESKRRIRNLLEASGLLAQLHAIAAKPASDEDLLRVHSRAYLDKLCETSRAGGGAVGPDMRTHKATYDIARLAAGGTIAAVEGVLDGTVGNAYALVRPPGHHAQVDEAQGFCYLANVAVACRWAQARRGVGRIAVIDWDVHHGNGTQAIFWEDPSVLAISLHQEGYFPAHLGKPDEVGAGAGQGKNLNIPLPAGCGHDAYMAAFDQVVEPVLRRWQPDLIMVACGFDAANFDPTARMMLHSDSFREMTRRLMDVAADTCNGRLVLSHEGGYSPTTVPYLALAVIEQLSGLSGGVLDPFLERWRAFPGQKLASHQADAIARVAERARAVGLLA